MSHEHEIEETIKEIAAKHGIAVGRDDPLLILQTMNNRLLQASQKAQQDMLDHHKEELEAIAMRWREDANDKAERILNASLAASKASMEKMMLSGAREMNKVVQTDIENILIRINKPLRDAQKIAVLNIVSASLSIIAAALVLWATVR
ncbi:MAG: conjugal transfer protein TraM [Methylococcaceae bacterium]|nr:conjugal transfer protein TraM [Methylococcaceae bacterium]